MWKNGTRLRFDENGSQSWKQPYYHYSHRYRRHVFKCFGIEITDKDITSLRIALKNDLCPNEANTQEGRFDMIVLFHYPFQIVRSLHGQYRYYRKNNLAFKLIFKIKDVEVIERRNKRSLKCIQMWQDYDNIIFEKRMRSEAVSYTHLTLPTKA